MLVDSHCHLNLLDLTSDEGDVSRVIERAKQQDVRYFLNVCVEIAEFPTVLKTAEKFDCVSTSVGLHPNEQGEEVTTDQLIQFATHPKVVAIGETGLDYFRTTGEAEWQRERFRAHIQAAKKIKKPLIIHTRDAHADTLDIMRAEQASIASGVMHCFSEDWEVAKAALDMDFYISFSGVVTFKTATILQDVAKRVPLDRILVETDSPYLAPVPHRGKPNEPAYVRHTAEYIANLRGISYDELAKQTTHNFFHLFSGAAKPNV